MISCAHIRLSRREIMLIWRRSGRSRDRIRVDRRTCLADRLPYDEASGFFARVAMRMRCLHQHSRSTATMRERSSRICRVGSTGTASVLKTDIPKGRYVPVARVQRGPSRQARHLGSISVPLRSALIGRPLDVQRPRLCVRSVSSMVEHLTFNQRVGSSSLLRGIIGTWCNW